MDPQIRIKMLRIRNNAMVYLSMNLTKRYSRSVNWLTNRNTKFPNICNKNSPELRLTPSPLPPITQHKANISNYLLPTRTLHHVKQAQQVFFKGKGAKED
jgi:hypothetical protein